ncbi:hypothetical protein DESC_660049 [Desulfosarcina cetonica]|nr:hypothetical protein DESC_660049 [Desulfosarcina cetonica]
MSTTAAMNGRADAQNVRPANNFHPQLNGGNGGFCRFPPFNRNSSKGVSHGREPIIQKPTHRKAVGRIQRAQPVRCHRQGGLPSGHPAGQGVVRSLGGGPPGTTKVPGRPGGGSGLRSWTAGAHPAFAGRHLSGSACRGCASARQCPALVHGTAQHLAPVGGSRPVEGGRYAVREPFAGGPGGIGACLRRAYRPHPGSGARRAVPRGRVALLPRFGAMRHGRTGRLAGWPPGHRRHPCGTPQRLRVPGVDPPDSRDDYTQKPPVDGNPQKPVTCATMMNS